MMIFIMCGGYYAHFSKPKALIEVKGEKLIDRTIRLLTPYVADSNDIWITCNKGDEGHFAGYRCIAFKQSFKHIEKTGYYLDGFLKYSKSCIYLFGDVYYTEDAIEKIINKYKETTRNIFICNKYPFNDQKARVGEPFGWIVKDQEEFRAAITLCKKLQDRGRVIQDGKLRIPTNWDLSQVINGNSVNDFTFDKDDVLVIDDLTIDIDYQNSVDILEKKIKEG